MGSQCAQPQENPQQPASAPRGRGRAASGDAHRLPVRPAADKQMMRQKPITDTLGMRLHLHWKGSLFHSQSIFNKEREFTTETVVIHKPPV